MINKKNIIIVTILVLGIVIILCYFFSRLKTPAPEELVVVDIATTTPAETENIETMTDEEKAKINLPHIGIYKVLSRDDEGNVASYSFIGMKKPEPVELDLMTEEEKIKYGIGPFDAQVLSRDSEGNITAYHIIRGEGNIVTEY